MTVPYVDLVEHNRALRPRILEAVDRVLCHGQFINGPEVTQLEQSLATRLGVADVVGVSSGTSALTLAMRAIGIGPGDEVITVAHSYVATASAIALVGATPVFVDVEPTTGLIDPDHVSRALSSRSKAIVPVHLGGVPCFMRPLETLCEKHGLHLIEDCAQAIGSKHRDRSVGSFGTGCFSMHPLKSFSACGDAGFITTNDVEQGALLRRLRSIGHRDRDHVDALGENARLDTLQAAILLAKLPHLDDWIAARRHHATAYANGLGDSFELTAVTESSEPAYSTFVIRLDGRDDLIAHLTTHGFDAKVHYPVPIHRQPAFAHLAAPSLPETERLVSRIVSLPVTPELCSEDRDRLIELLSDWRHSHA
ncbi:MAG: DegT/DnrJ/EryC1/StrS family aminotransferase [Polyangiales bacterium]